MIPGGALELDHVLLAAVDLDEASHVLEARHSLTVVGGGRHPGWGTANRIVPLGDAYLELVAAADEAEAACTAFGRWVLAGRASPFAPLGWAVRTANLDGEAARLGLTASDGVRERPDGSVLRWRLAGVDESAAEPFRPFFIEWPPCPCRCGEARPRSPRSCCAATQASSPWGRAESRRSSISCGSRRTRASSCASRLCSSSARGSVSGRRRPARISSSSTPPSRPPYVV